MGATGLEPGLDSGEKQGNFGRRSDLRSDSAGNFSEKVAKAIARDPRIADVVAAWPRLTGSVQEKIVRLASKPSQARHSARKKVAATSGVKRRPK
jgi:hypothetical protein